MDQEIIIKDYNDSFVLIFHTMVSELQQITGIDFLQRERRNNPITLRLKSIVASHNSLNFKLRDYELSILKFFINDLIVIKKHRENLYKKYKQLIRHQSNENYTGIRFEVKITSLFINKGIKFEKLDPPDFSIEVNNNNVFVECTSCHLKSNLPKDIKYKFDSALAKKVKKGYNHPKTVLFIDYTNLAFNILLNNKGKEAFIQLNNIRMHIKDKLKECSFGSIVLFLYMIDINLNRVSHMYLREDNKSIDENLLLFLNKYYPKGMELINNFEVPIRG